MEQKKFSISKRLKSFVYAFNGLIVLFKEEHNARIHLIATILVITAAVLLKLNFYEWIAVTFAIGFVISVEIINTVIENMADFVSPAKNDKIKKIKDLSAAAVLISSMTALTIGLIVFIPKIKMIF
ncbi:MAG TPA: diacylglycerol kinase family protein [Bacteroidales bacterium]|nr:diacylglycerol kinase family protein [Bacteroidales bacterium]HOR82328.1 diacylglycerol kinase family protein [Bacteroidales bacterium]HPJ91586.1 diacylglycerol kinase family protein [Bacteroidales bacterium]